MVTNARVPHRDRLADWMDKYLFMIVFAVGAVLMVSLKLLDVRQLFVTLAPVGAMILYGFYVFATPRFRQRADRAGDSLYYLGFLYTMVSLAYSLYEFGGPKIDTQSIVTNFGIALSTTILGLVGRVAYHQIRQDPFDVEYEAHMQLAEAAAKLHGELLQTVTDFNVMRSVTVQSLNEGVSDIKAAVANVVEGCTSDYKESVGELASAVRTTATELKQHNATTRGLLEECARNYATSATELANAIRAGAAELKRNENAAEESARNIITTFGDLSKRIEQIDVPPDILKVKIQRVVDQLVANEKAAVESVRRIISTFEGLTKRIEQIEVPPDILKAKLQHVVDPLVAAIETILQKTQTDQGRITDLEKLIKDTTTLATKLTADINALQVEAGRQREAIQMAMTGLQKNIEMVNSAASATVAISEKNVKEQQAILQALAKESVETLNTVKDHRSRLDSDVKASTALVSQVQESLVSLTRTIVEKLNGRKV